MDDKKQELLNLIDCFTEYQIHYIITLAVLINKLTEYQTRYVLAFIKKRFNL